MNEIKLTENSGRTLCGRIAQALEDAGAKIVSSDDYKQLLYPTDQIYIDYTWQEKLFTLHLEHTLGISLFSDELDISALNEIAHAINSSELVRKA